LCSSRQCVFLAVAIETRAAGLGEPGKPLLSDKYPSCDLSGSYLGGDFQMFRFIAIKITRTHEQAFGEQKEYLLCSHNPATTIATSVTLRPGVVVHICNPSTREARQEV
jgi:hypothetical protein